MGRSITPRKWYLRCNPAVERVSFEEDLPERRFICAVIERANDDLFVKQSRIRENAVCWFFGIDNCILSFRECCNYVGLDYAKSLDTVRNALK